MFGTKLAEKDVERFEELHGEYRSETDAAERAKRRNRLGCFTKTLIKKTKTSAGLECIQILMDTFDPTRKFGPPAVFPPSLWSHLESKIVNCKAIERKPIADAERRARKAARRENRSPQRQAPLQQLTPAEAQ